MICRYTSRSRPADRSNRFSGRRRSLSSALVIPSRRACRSSSLSGYVLPISRGSSEETIRCFGVQILTRRTPAAARRGWSTTLRAAAASRSPSASRLSRFGSTSSVARMSVACRASARASSLAARWLAHTLPPRSRMTPIRFARTKRPTTWPTDGGRRSERPAAAPSTRRTHSGEESLDTDGSTIVVPSSTAVPHPLRLPLAFPPWGPWLVSATPGVRCTRGTAVLRPRRRMSYDLGTGDAAERPLRFLEDRFGEPGGPPEDTPAVRDPDQRARSIHLQGGPVGRSPPVPVGGHQVSEDRPGRRSAADQIPGPQLRAEVGEVTRRAAERGAVPVDEARTRRIQQDVVDRRVTVRRDESIRRLRESGHRVGHEGGDPARRGGEDRALQIGGLALD